MSMPLRMDQRIGSWVTVASSHWVVYYIMLRIRRTDKSTASEAIYSK